MKSLILINEDFYKMHLGQNTSLFYLVQELENGNDVWVFNLDQNLLPENDEKPISCLFLEKKPS